MIDPRSLEWWWWRSLWGKKNRRSIHSFINLIPIALLLVTGERESERSTDRPISRSRENPIDNCFWNFLLPLKDWNFQGLHLPSFIVRGTSVWLTKQLFAQRVKIPLKQIIVYFMVKGQSLSLSPSVSPLIIHVSVWKKKKRRKGLIWAHWWLPFKSYFSLCHIWRRRQRHPLSPNSFLPTSTCKPLGETGALPLSISNGSSWSCPLSIFAVRISYCSQDKKHTKIWPATFKNTSWIIWHYSK